MAEVALVASDADDGPRARLDAEINAFNVVATGYADGELLCVIASGAPCSPLRRRELAQRLVRRGGRVTPEGFGPIGESWSSAR